MIQCGCFFCVRLFYQTKPLKINKKTFSGADRIHRVLLYYSDHQFRVSLSVCLMLLYLFCIMYIDRLAFTLSKHSMRQDLIKNVLHCGPFYHTCPPSISISKSASLSCIRCFASSSDAWRSVRKAFSISASRAS